jgi:hypothetical protein
MIGPPRRLAAALTGVGVLLCVLGWYQASGQPTVAQQIPYLASATIPGAALLAAGCVALLRWSAPAGRTPGGVERADRAPAPQPSARPAAEGAFLRVPDGRYLHIPECPLMDGRADAVPVSRQDAAAAELRPCPLCAAEAAADHATAPSPGGSSAAQPDPDGRG